jgi:hypothetical protein
MVKYDFINSSEKLTPAELYWVEIEIGRSIPDVLKEFLLHHNGGELAGDKCVFVEQESGGEFNVNTFLPVKYKRFEDDYLLEDCYKFFARNKKFMPPEFIPFAIDDGGYPFALNSENLSLSICYLADIEENAQPMRFVSETLANFINGLVNEDEAYG